jgi:hypothetical protein
MTQPQGELIQLMLLLAYLVRAGRVETLLTRAVVLWWIVVLLVDIFVWQCARPAWLQVGINSLDFMLGWLILYEKYRHPCKNMVVALLALLGSLVK